MGLLLKDFRLHCAVMLVLYLCQGLAQGTLQIMILLLLQDHPELSAADQATLALPMYSFSLKFLWAPVVDRYYRECGCRERRRPSCKDQSPPCAGYHCIEDSPKTKCSDPSSDTAASSPTRSRTRAQSYDDPHTYSFFHRLHRRVQWVVALELVMGATYAWLYHVGDSAYMEAIVKQRTVFWQLFLILCVLSFANATQDVAVDAWVVEGLDQAHVSTAGMLQLVGVTTGVSLANIFVPLRAAFPHIFTLRAFFLACGCLCGVCAVLAVLLAWCRRLFNEHRLEAEAAELRRKRESNVSNPFEDSAVVQQEATKPGDDEDDDDDDSTAEPHTGILQTLREIFATQGLRELVAVYVTRGWPLAVFPLIVSRLISMRVVSAGAIARYRIYSTVAQVLVAAYASVALLRYVKAPRVIQFISGFDFFLNIVIFVCFVTVAVPAAASWFGVTVVLPITVLIFGVGALGFVANVSLQARFAHLFPRDVGGVLSLLAAISNMGHHLPGTFCLYAASFVVQLCTWYTGEDTSYATYYATKRDTSVEADSSLGFFSSSQKTESSIGETSRGHNSSSRLPSYWVKMDVIACGTFFFVVGIILRYAFLVPASDRLTDIVTAADDKELRGCPDGDESQPLLHI